MRSEGDERKLGMSPAFWAALLVVSIATHFVALGDRAMSHDESIHAQLSWELYENGMYSHDPTFHGPFLYHLNAVVFSLLGDNDWTARLGPAVAGILLLAAIYSLRRYLGSTGALCAALFVTISPSLLFYGRHLRNDIFMALFALLWVLGILRYLEDRRPRWLLLIMAAMALSFTTKETAFLTGLSLGSFLVFWTWSHVRRGVQTWRESASGELAMVMMLTVLPFASPLLHLAMGWDPVDYEGPEAWRRALLAVSLPVAICFGAAWALWRSRNRSSSLSNPLTFVRWCALFALFWGVQIVLFTSVFREAPRGLVSGLVGSLGYWLGQHGVARGSQPPSYYLILLTLYEYLPLVLSLMGAAALLRRRVRERTTGREPETTPPSAPWLLLWWWSSSWLAYSLAGERMPWLTVHIALPMALFAGWWSGRVIDRIDWSGWTLRRLSIPAIAPLVLLHFSSRLLATTPASGRTLEAITSTTNFGYAFVLAVAALIACGLWLRRHQGDAGGAKRVLGLGFVLALVVFTAQASWRLAFRNDELATELMVYAHATPDIKQALTAAEDITRRAGLEGALFVAFDTESSWPFTWYLRHNQTLFIGEMPSAQVTQYAVVLAGPESQDRLWPFLGSDYGVRDLTLVWWPIERLTKFTIGDVARVVADPESTRAAWRYVALRELPESDEARWPNRQDFRMYVRRDLLARSWGLQSGETRTAFGSRSSDPPVKEVRVKPLTSFSGPFQGDLLRMPTQIAVSPDGTRAIADAGNNRVVLVSNDGSLVRVLGGECGDTDPCTEATFQEPWGVAAMPGGGVAVANTWQGRIHFYGPRGNLLKTFGEALIHGSPPFPTDRLFGPRAIFYHAPSSRLLIADTGHHRILALDEQGGVQEIGAPGVLKGYFQEPVGLAHDPSDGSVLVADTWNRRIQRLDRDFVPLSMWPVPGWQGQGPYNKPFLAIDSRGFVYASDPDAARVLVFNREGGLQGAMVSAGWRGTQRSIPLGVAVDLENKELLVSDAGLGRVWVLPLWP